MASTTLTLPDADGEDGDIALRRSRYSTTFDDYRHAALSDNHHLSSPAPQSRSSSRNSFASDIDGEVDGGVALTEEAIATHTPDLVTQT